MILTLFYALLCVPNGLSDNFESTRGKPLSAFLSSSPLPPTPSSSSSSSSLLLSLNQNKSPLLTSANNWYPTLLVLTTTAPPNASNVDDWADQQADPTVAAGETKTSNSGNHLHDELCPPDANLNGNSLEKRNKTAFKVTSNCHTAVLQKPSVVKFYGEKINPPPSAFKSEKRNLTNNFISPHSINAKTSPNGEITVINGKSVTGILYAHQHSPIIPQFEKLTAPGRNYIVTKTGSEDTAASENKAEHVDKKNDEEGDEGDEKDGGDEEVATSKASNESKNEKSDKAQDTDHKNKHDSEKDNDGDDNENDSDGGPDNQYSQPSKPISLPPSSTTTTTSMPSPSPSPSQVYTTSTLKTNPTVSITTSTSTNRPAKIRFPPRRPDYILKAKYGDKLDKPVQTSSTEKSTTNTTTTRPRYQIPTQSATRRPFLVPSTTTTAPYSQHNQASVPKKINSQIEALRNRYKSNKVSGVGRVPSVNSEPPAGSPKATPNKVTVEYTTTTTTTTESLLKYELDHNSMQEPKQKENNEGAVKSKNATPHYLNHDHNKSRMKQLRGKENKNEHEQGNPTETPISNMSKNYNVAPPTDTTKKQIPKPNNVRYQKETYKNIATTVRPRGLNRWTNYRNPSTPDYRYFSSTSPTPFPVKMSFPENAYYTPIPSTEPNYNYNSQHQQHSSANQNSQSFLPTHTNFENLRHQDFASTVSPHSISFAPQKQHSTNSHQPESVSDYNFSNSYFVQNPQSEQHSHHFQHLPSSTTSPEMFVTIENQFIVLRNQTPILQKEILLPPFPESNQQQQHQQNKFNNVIFDLPFGGKENQLKMKHQNENFDKPSTVSYYNLRNNNKMANHFHSENNQQSGTPVTLAPLMPTKNPAEMMFYYEQNNKPRLNYRLVHSPGSQKESKQTLESPLSLFDHLNLSSFDRPLSNTIQLLQPTMLPNKKQHLLPKMNMFKPIDITPNKARPIVFNDHMSSPKNLNHAGQSSLSTTRARHLVEGGKSTSTSYSLSPIKPGPFERNRNHPSGNDPEYTVVRHYVRTLDYDQNKLHPPSTIEFDDHLNVANEKDGSQMTSNVVPSPSSVLQYFGLPRSKSQMTMLSDDEKERYQTNSQMVTPTVALAQAKPTQAIVFNFNVPPRGTVTRQPQLPQPESFNTINLRDISLLTNLKRPTPNQTPSGIQYQPLPIIASKPTANPDISAVFMPDARPNIVPVATTIFESEPLNAENLFLTKNVDKTPIFSVNSNQQFLPFQSHSHVRANRAMGRQNEKPTQAQNKRLKNERFYSKLKQSVPRDIMDEGSAESKIHEMMKPSADPFEEYYSDRILPLNAMIDYSGVLWNAENPAESNRVNLLHTNSTQPSNSRPSSLNDNAETDETSKLSVKSKLKDFLLMFNEVRAGNQSRQQRSGNQVKPKTTADTEPAESGESILEQTQLVPVFSNTVENLNQQNDVSKETRQKNKNFEGSISTSAEQQKAQPQQLLLWQLKPSVSPSEMPSTAQPVLDFRFRRNQRILSSLKTIFGLSSPQINLPVLNSAARLYS